MFIDDDHVALACRIIASDAGIVGVAEPVVCGVEEPLEHHRIGYVGEVSLGISV
jgi:hypothetical protein